MPSPKLRSSPDAPNFDQAASLDQEATDPEYDTDFADPDYDEDGQGEFADEFTEPDYEDAGREYRPRKQK